MFTSIKIIALFFVLTLSACFDSQQTVDKQEITIQTPSGQQAVFFVDVADTPKEMQKGLMFVEEMPIEEGMIFLYPEQRQTFFWMKNTLIPLDIMFFDKNNELIHVEHSAIPHDKTPRGPQGPICSVVEINGGLAKKMNIPLGSKLITNLSQECLQSPAD